jgi:cytoskeletal protein CcmA (bactofilin family)
MFRKKHDDDDGLSKPQHNGDRMQDLTAPPLKPFSRKGSHVPAKAPTGGTAAVRHDIPRRTSDSPPPPRRFDRLRPGESESKKLTVGRDICLKGEITSCDKLIVEGRVEVALEDARAIEIAPTGFFKGSAAVEEADISGLYEGELVARELLTVRAGGRINGTVRYGRIVIEAGGEISGDMRALSQADEAAPHEARPAEETLPAWPSTAIEAEEPQAEGGPAGDDLPDPSQA